MSDITPFSAVTLAAVATNTSLSNSWTASNGFRAQLQDALQNSTPEQGATTSTTQASATAHPQDGASRTPASSFLNHSRAYSDAPATQPGTTQPASMTNADQPTATSATSTAKAGADAADTTTIAVPAGTAAMLQLGVAAASDGTDTLSPPAVTTRPATSDTGGSARMKKAGAGSEDDDADVDAAGTVDSQTTGTPPAAPALAPDTQPTAKSDPTQPAPAASDQAVEGAKTRDGGENGGRAAHAGTTHATATDTAPSDTALQVPAQVQALAASATDPTTTFPAALQVQTSSLPHNQSASLASAQTGAVSTGDATMAAGDTTAAAQLAGPMVTLSRGTDGASSMAVSLHPKELGTVTITLDRDAAGAVRVVVAATEPSTLRSLIADQSHLHAALDAAAVPAADRQVSFELTGSQTGSDSTPGQAAQNDGGDGQQGGGAWTQQQRPGSDDPGAAAQTATIPMQVQARSNRYRAGVNITA